MIGFVQEWNINVHEKIIYTKIFIKFCRRSTITLISKRNFIAETHSDKRKYINEYQVHIYFFKKNKEFNCKQNFLNNKTSGFDIELFRIYFYLLQ